MTYSIGTKTFNFNRHVYVMGILNVTPDSFADGGKYFSGVDAIRRGLTMIEEGAEIIDIGGESTRPRGAYGEGAEIVEEEEELRRIIPVIEELAKQRSVPLSVDTYKSSVARRAIEAGATIVNDISGLTFDSAMSATVAQGKATLIAMHIQGTPKTMQTHPIYKDVVQEVKEFLADSVMRARNAGVQQIVTDVGFGFGKTLEHNYTLLRNLERTRVDSLPILAGLSRKSMIGTVLGNLPPDERLYGSLAAAAVAMKNGANILRVHDVKPTVEFVKVWERSL